LRQTDKTALEERRNPHDAFKGHTAQTSWDDLNLVYFHQLSDMWLSARPFHFVMPEVKTKEIEPWKEDGGPTLCHECPAVFAFPGLTIFCSA
jgi:hypothetical protein